MTVDDLERARAEGATDVAIHDAVLIAAAFCIYSRYVDGLVTWQPRDASLYEQMGKNLAQQSYLKAVR